MLEYGLRREDGRSVRAEDIKAMAGRLRHRRSDREITFRPSSVVVSMASANERKPAPAEIQAQALGGMDDEEPGIANADQPETMEWMP